MKRLILSTLLLALLAAPVLAGRDALSPIHI